MPLLSDPLPLRDTSAWPGYDRIQVIPRVYGRARLAPIRYNDAGTLLVLADHPMAGVDRVTLDGAPIDYRWRNGADMTGHAVALLEIASAPDTGAKLAADVRGLSGNPADILADLYPRSDLQDFRRYCANQNLVLGGALDNKMTVRAAVDFVLHQIGAVWSAGLPGLARVFPPDADGPIWANLGRLDLSDWSCECEVGHLVTRLTVPFDWDAAAAKARQSVVLDAPAASRVHGEREAELSLPWVRDARQAVATATAHLQWRARPLWTLQCSTNIRHRGIEPGGWIAVDHPRLPGTGRYVVTDLDPGYGKGVVSITAQAPAGHAPAVRLIRQSTAFEPIRTDYQINPGADTAVLTITDPGGRKLPGASVWIDGKGPLIADAGAAVRFAATPGTHVVRIEAAGMAAITTSITL